MTTQLRNTVQECRRASDRTQETLARACGVTRQTIISIEKGRYVPSVALALRISKELGQPVDVLFTIQ